MGGEDILISGNNQAVAARLKDTGAVRAAIQIWAKKAHVQLKNEFYTVLIHKNGREIDWIIQNFNYLPAAFLGPKARYPQPSNTLRRKSPNL